MKRIAIYLLFICAIHNSLCAQQITAVQQIKQSLDEFMTAISGINDPECKENIKSVVREFTTSNYFQFNNADVDALSFFETYCSRYLQGDIISHRVRDVDVKEKGRMCWEISCKLTRESSVNTQTYIRDTHMNLIIRFEGGSENIKILSISFSPEIEYIRPTWNKEYVFQIADYKGLRQGYQGGEWSIVIDSKARDVKKIDGKINQLGDYYRVPFKVKTSADFKIDTTSINTGCIRGYIPQNTTKSSKSYMMEFAQIGNNKVLKETITQEKKPSFFDFDCYDAAMHQVDVIYSLKYNIGLGYTITIPDTRVSVGIVAASNFNSFRGIFSNNNNNKSNYTTSYNVENNIEINVGNDVNVDVGVNVNNNTDSEVTNGYKKGVTEYLAKNSRYSSLMDPHNEATHFQSRSFFIAQVGMYMCQWIRFDLGIGAARCQTIHYMNDAYDVTKYSYEPLYENLPPIEDIYAYRRSGGGQYYRDKTLWGVAIRPAINCQIPLSYSIYLTLGVGYLYTPTLSKSSSLDFNIGLGWNIF